MKPTQHTTEQPNDDDELVFVARRPVSVGSRGELAASAQRRQPAEALALGANHNKDSDNNKHLSLNELSFEPRLHAWQARLASALLLLSPLPPPSSPSSSLVVDKMFVMNESLLDQALNE